jgi:hypothetical protein
MNVFGHFSLTFRLLCDCLVVQISKPQVCKAVVEHGVRARAKLDRHNQPSPSHLKTSGITAKAVSYCIQSYLAKYPLFIFYLNFFYIIYINHLTSLLKCFLPYFILCFNVEECVSNLFPLSSNMYNESPSV